MVAYNPQKGKNKMKIPKARKLSSGSWFVRVQIDGHSIPITKPTEKEAIAEAMALKAKTKDADLSTRKTVSGAIDAYIAARENILSPSTIKGYKAIRRLRFQSIMGRRISDIPQSQWQTIVNKEAALCSAKTLKNAWCFIASVIAEETGKQIKIRLPQVVKADRPWLSPEQIPVFMEAIAGDPVEIPALLALSSLRRSELLGLTWKDIDPANHTLKVSGAAVYDGEGKLIRKKETKNVTSRRTVPLIPRLQELLESHPATPEPVVTWHGNSISNRINRICEKKDLPKVGLHGLRHSFASLLYHLKVPEQIAMQMGGWKDSRTMHGIYTHIAQKDIATHAEQWVSFFLPQPASKL